MMQFQGFKPEAMNRIAKALGHEGDMGGFQDFLEKNPEKKEMMEGFNKKAIKMMQGGYVKGYANGGVAQPTLNMPPQKPNMPIIKNPNIEAGYYDSPEYKDFMQNKSTGIGTTNIRYSPYFGQQGSGSIGAAADSAYEAYLKRTGNTGYLQGGDQFNQAPGAPGFLNTGLPQQVKNIAIADPNPQILTPDGTFQNYSMDKFIGLPIDEISQRSALPPQQDPRNLSNSNTQTTSTDGNATQITDIVANNALNPMLPEGGVVQPVGTEITAGQMQDPRLGQLGAMGSANTIIAGTNAVQQPTQTAANTMQATQAADAVAAATDQVSAAQGTVSDPSKVAAATDTTSSVSDLTAAQGTGVLMQNPTQRKIETGELIDGVANAETASKFAEELQAAEATPSKEATVQGQLETLMASFEGGATPPWAAGAMRAVSAQMAARGLGASSMAGQAMVQGAMEAALPIAVADAKTQATFESQNLSNKQQRVMLAAEQRAKFIGQEFDQSFQARVMNATKISEIANLNFTAEQQVALENSRIANTVGLANLTNRQAMIMAEAGALANLDMSNLSNRQQAAVQNAQSFLQMDMANLSNLQQTNMFKGQQRIQSLFTDQAADNAAKQFNATSKNQTDQFFANLTTQTSQFNAAQANAQNQYNAGQANAMTQFNQEIRNQRDQFNATNRLVIDQANVQWRRQVATADTAAVNRANELNASSLLGISNTAMNNLWTHYSDNMEFAWKSTDNERERLIELAIAQMHIEGDSAAASAAASGATAAAFGKLISNLFLGDFL